MVKSPYFYLLWIAVLFYLSRNGIIIVDSFVLCGRSTLGAIRPLWATREVAVAVETVLDVQIQEHISNLVQERAEARWRGDYAAADALREKIDIFPLPLPHFRVIIADVPRGKGGGSTWSLVYDVPLDEISTGKQHTVLQLSHSALGMAVTYAERGLSVPPDEFRAAVTDAKEQLRKWYLVARDIRSSNDKGANNVSFTKLSRHAQTPNDSLPFWLATEKELSGRKAADAAFWFALAGVTDTELFDLLTKVCIKEVERFGARPSCRPKDILAIVERLAAAGIQNEECAYEFVTVVQRCLQGKNSSQVLSQPMLSLHSDYCAYMVWNFSTRHRKQRLFLTSASRHWQGEAGNSIVPSFGQVRSGTGELDWNELFHDPTRPLVVDVGSGMGISLLGLALLRPSDCTDFNWAECNFVGVDLSPLTTSYAKGIAQRWNLRGKLAFVVDSAEHFMDCIKSYPGPVNRILIQFPTPYRLRLASTIDDNSSGSISGNSQLPRTMSDGFMVTPSLLQQAASLLSKPNGELVIQSNCEDVAVSMRQIAMQDAGFSVRDSGECVQNIGGNPTQRTLKWIESGGERAIGKGWYAEPILPPNGRTETEIACFLNGTPVHRCVLIPSLLSS